MSKDYYLLEGSRAIATVIKNISPAVVSAYPITPQTHIVEDLAKLRANGQADFEYIRAESEFAAASIVLGASASGVRTYSATSSQGLLLMTEVIFNIAGMRLPIVMTCANRAISAPINIWNDHSDVMTVRDAGWIQLFAANAQEMVDAHILAYKLAEKLSLPVMVNVDGFILTHSYETVEIPGAEKIKKFLPTYRPVAGTYLDPNQALTLGAFFTPANYLETRESLQRDLVDSLKTISQEYRLFKKIFKRRSSDNGLVEYHGPKKPDLILVALGSMTGTILETLKKYPSVGLLKIKVYRPFPAAAVLAVLKRTKNVAVLEKAISLGGAGPLFADISASYPARKPLANLKNYIVGLGGRDLTQKMIEKIIKSHRKRDKLIFLGK